MSLEARTDGRRRSPMPCGPEGYKSLGPRDPQARARALPGTCARSRPWDCYLVYVRRLPLRSSLPGLCLCSSWSSHHLIRVYAHRGTGTI